jgi:surface antigen
MVGRHVAAMGVVALLVAGCTASDYGTKEVAGALVGAGAGGLIGSQFGKGSGKLAATGAGTLLGAALGAAAGQSLDRADQLHAARADHRASEFTSSSGPVPWRNPDSGYPGGSGPGPSGAQSVGVACRDFKDTIYIDGVAHEARGRACRQADGTWQIVD